MSEGRHLFLVGFMGAGKSTVGRIVADRLGLPLIDLDSRIEQRAGLPISGIFAEKGEEAFREFESVSLAALTDEPPSVVACGGGVVLRAENRALLRQLGRVVYLKVTAGEALARVGDAASRPLLAGPGGALAATSLLSAREALYRSVADATVDTMAFTPDQVAEKVVSEVRGER